jgi:single-strand DNA-binding protein
MFIGHLGKDPEISYTASGIAVCKFSIACSESWKGEDGEKKERTEWINIVAWRKLAEICGKYLVKGSKVFVEGKFTTRTWDDKNNGIKRYATEIVLDDIIMLNNKQAGEGGKQEYSTAQHEPEKEDLPF